MATNTAPVTAAAGPIAPGDRARSEFGTGVVVGHTRRSLTHQLDAGGPPLNVVAGIPGYYRVVRENRLELTRTRHIV